MEGCESSNTLNFSAGAGGSAEAARPLLYGAFDRTLVALVLPVIAASGLLCNLSFLFVVARVPRMQTVTNLYLSQLALADLLYLLLALAEKAVLYLASPVARDMTVLGFGGSVAVYLGLQLLHAETLILVTVVVLERYSALFRPVRLRARWCRGGRRRAARVSAATWALAAVLVSTVGPWLGEFRLTCVVWPDAAEFAGLAGRVRTLLVVHGARVSHYDLVAEPLPDSLWYTIAFAAIASVNTALLVRMVRALRMRRAAVAPQLTGAHRRQAAPAVASRLARVRNQVSWMLVFNGALFLVLMAPRKIYDLARSITVAGGSEVLGRRQRCALHYLFSVMVYLNSAVNPVVYSVVSPRYRRAFRRAFTFRRRAAIFPKY